jgi:hypothetical protein
MCVFIPSKSVFRFAQRDDNKNHNALMTSMFKNEK